MDHFARARYLPGLPLGADGRRVTDSKAHQELSRRAAREGAVLLKNEGGVLPLGAGSRVALVGKGIADFVKGGGGSGDVTVSECWSVLDGFRRKELEGKLSICHALAGYYEDWVKSRYQEGMLPGLVEEPPFPDGLASESSADIAVVVISRFSGEGWDRGGSVAEPWVAEQARQASRTFPHGDYSLTDAEKAMVEGVKRHWDKVVVVLNVGGVVDSLWFAGDPHIQGVLFAGQGGMMGGLAVSDLLSGEACPSGKLADTFALDLDAYPSTASFHESDAYVEYPEDIFIGYRYFSTIKGKERDVVYPFGFGLSYTTFKREEVTSGFDGTTVTLKVRVTNIGSMAGKDVVEVYVSSPPGPLDTPKKVLVSFGKTRLLKSGESQVLDLSFPLSVAASYDDQGKVCDASWVLQKGKWSICFGSSSEDLVPVSPPVVLAKHVVVETLTHRLVPHQLHKRLHADGSYEPLSVEPYAPDCCQWKRMEAEDMETNLPEVRALPSLKREDFIRLQEMRFDAVAEGTQSLDSFVSGLDDESLCSLLGGQPNMGLANTLGIGNQPLYGIPDVMTADGPAGVRLLPETHVTTTAFPVASLLAASWDTDLVEAVGRAAGLELKENNLFIWLAPAVNIHHSPLCGRNFEYYSEDPLLTGKLAAAMVRGTQSAGVSATVKHFACNGKETNRKESDSILSERAAREIYLRQFEIIVKEAQPHWIMSSYNLINGVRTSESKELLTDILRGEWGYQGAVMTDWWNHGEQYLEVKAGGDVKMGSGYPKRLKQALDKGFVSRDELRLAAKRILAALLKVDD